MSWVESHQEIARHPKTKRLARALDISIPTTVGHLHILWHWCLDFAQDGDVTEFWADTIADAAMWEGDPETFALALVNTGWLDDAGDGSRIMIHDWDDYAGKLIEKRRADAERKRAARAKDVQDTSSGHPTDIPVTAHVTVPNLTGQDTTEPNRTEPDQPRARAPVVADTPYAVFVAFCEETGTVEADVAPKWKDKQIAIGLRLIEQGFGQDKVRRCTAYMRSQEWRTSPFDLGGVEKYIGTWEAGGMPERDAPPRASPQRHRSKNQPDFAGIEAVADAMRAGQT